MRARNDLRWFEKKRKKKKQNQIDMRERKRDKEKKHTERGSDDTEHGYKKYNI